MRSLVKERLNGYLMMRSYSKPTWEGDYEIFKWILEDKPFFSAKFVYDRNQNLVDKTVTFYDK